MDADEALIQAWNLGEGRKGWSTAAMDEAERLLPILIEAGYAETIGNAWNFTDSGVARAKELRLWGVESEELVDELLAALYSAEQALVARRAQLAGEPGWSDVTSEFRPTHWFSSVEPNAERRLGFSGYIDGEYIDLGGLAWIFDLIRDEGAWKVERGLHLNRNTTDYQEIVAKLPTVVLSDSRELAVSLPQLLLELFDMPPPDA
jgi:hypothetical protein